VTDRRQVERAARATDPPPEAGKPKAARRLRGISVTAARPSDSGDTYGQPEDAAHISKPIKPALRPYQHELLAPPAAQARDEEERNDVRIERAGRHCVTNGYVTNREAEFSGITAQKAPSPADRKASAGLIAGSVQIAFQKPHCYSGHTRLYEQEDQAQGDDVEGNRRE